LFSIIFPEFFSFPHFSVFFSRLRLSFFLKKTFLPFLDHSPSLQPVGTSILAADLSVFAFSSLVFPRPSAQHVNPTPFLFSASVIALFVMVGVSFFFYAGCSPPAPVHQMMNPTWCLASGQERASRLFWTFFFPLARPSLSWVRCRFSFCDPAGLFSGACHLL